MLSDVHTSMLEVRDEGLENVTDSCGMPLSAASAWRAACESDVRSRQGKSRDHCEIGITRDFLSQVVAKTETGMAGGGS